MEHQHQRLTSPTGNERSDSQSVVVVVVEDSRHSKQSALFQITLKPSRKEPIDGENIAKWPTNTILSAVERIYGTGADSIDSYEPTKYAPRGCTYTHTYTHTHIHTYIHTHTHTHTHTHIHTYTPHKPMWAPLFCVDLFVGSFRFGHSPYGACGW